MWKARRTSKGAVVENLDQGYSQTHKAFLTGEIRGSQFFFYNFEIALRMAEEANLDYWPVILLTEQCDQVLNYGYRIR